MKREKIGVSFRADGSRCDMICNGKTHFWRDPPTPEKLVNLRVIGPCDCDNFMRLVAAMFGVKL